MRKKLKLFIVDDEKYVRDLLKLSIDWEALDIEICGEASCAEEALLLIDELQPNIIFTDICMEYMNGIEFSQRVLKNHPYLKIVILSGHNRFDYAAQGISVGVSAYLLKPLDEEKILDTVRKIRKTIDDEESQLLEITRLKDYLAESKNSMIESNLNALVEPHSDFHSAIRRLNYLNISFQNSYFQIASVKIMPFENDGGEERQLILDMECRHLLETLLPPEDIYLFYDLNHRNTILSNNAKINLTELSGKLLALCLEKLNCTMTIGVGNPVKLLPQLKVSYQNAKEAVRYRAILGNNQVIPYRSVAVSDKESDFLLDESITSLLNMIKNEQLEHSFQIVSACISNFMEQDTTDIIPIRILISTIINHIMELLLKNNLRDTDAFHYALSSYDRLFRLQTAEELQNMTNNLIRAVIETFSSIRCGKNNALINSVLQYLNENYTDADITLNSTAEHFFVNSSYLSRLFRQQMETTFTKYLTELRLSKAEKLLSETGLRAYEVGLAVGFRDAKYFSACFRKHFGVTINDYRQDFLNSR